MIDLLAAWREMVDADEWSFSGSLFEQQISSILARLVTARPFTEVAERLPSKPFVATSSSFRPIPEGHEGRK
jgi:hypothetical protein